jgi:hypothetical protein
MLFNFFVFFFKKIYFNRLRHDVNERPRYYSEILSMVAMTSVEQNPSEDEVILVQNVLDALPPRTPE